ncbi:hypothetical protein DL89DRAFT_270174 [Linderina pennispora]|uniref:Uncharacterized protein n=1 Tax=Linderina pennispora TaxID=61395 RepID=A0A1Y1VZG3_9FUNG|nr:uncharacterized protein DL89DRAFT_270174 [Linderina pennispora]ORX66649.1 hypothetical protein DL89DRAFT_270174 [Linderina pennispora]
MTTPAIIGGVTAAAFIVVSVFTYKYMRKQSKARRKKGAMRLDDEEPMIETSSILQAPPLPPRTHSSAASLRSFSSSISSMFDAKSEELPPYSPIDPALLRFDDESDTDIVAMPPRAHV